MEEPSKRSKRSFELSLISKAFIHHMATSEVTRHALLQAFAAAPKGQTAPEDPDSLERRVAAIVNAQLHLDEAGLTLDAHEMKAFDFEMQKRHSELATPTNFNTDSFGYNSKFGTPPAGNGQGLGTSSNTNQPE